MTATADIVIIGGGIIGANIAYQLAMRGTTNVTILERDELSSGSSGRATGGLRQQFADEVDIIFSRESIRFYEQFTDGRSTTISNPPPFYQHGYMRKAGRQCSAMWHFNSRWMCLHDFSRHRRCSSVCHSLSLTMYWVRHSAQAMAIATPVQWPAPLSPRLKHKV
jgi:glycine/D-amino acid oxidase-like deaminating enzyme